MLSIVVMSNPRKTTEQLFTIEEANRLVPRLSSLLKRLIHSRERLVDLAPHIQPARENADANGGSIYGGIYLKELSMFTDSAQVVESLGVHIKDLRTGLCDFPHMRDGRVVYLCWKLGEDEVGWWHDIDAGFAGRRPL